MFTQTHVLIGLSLFGRPHDRPRNVMAIAGGIVPDAAIFVLYAIEKSRGTPERVIWREVYYSPFWQDVVAWGNSIPLWLLLLAIGAVIAMKSRFKTLASLLLVFAGSCLAHMACDFPLHVDDAHRHLFPISNWRFHSLVSYWDPNHFGVQAIICEAILGVVLSVWMWVRFQSIAARIGIAILLIGYLAVPAWFAFQFFTATV